MLSCKKDYQCECKGYSTQAQITNDIQVVSERSEKKAEESCIRAVTKYDDNYYTSNNIIIINCDLQQ